MNKIDLITVADAAEILGLSPGVIHYHIQQLHLEVVMRAGQTILLDGKQVRAFRPDGPGRKRSSKENFSS